MVQRLSTGLLLGKTTFWSLSPLSRHLVATPSSSVRTLSNSLPPQYSSSPQPLHQEEAKSSSSSSSSSSSQVPPRPYSKIPKTKTFLGLNTDAIKSATRIPQYMQEQALQLGPIYKIVGTPGIPEMVVTVNPEDVEKVYRLGDTAYPMRFPLEEWKQARKELGQPYGIFLQDGEEWHKQRLPISKFILMPRKMAEYHEPFNHVVQEYIDFLRKRRDEESVFPDIITSLNKWSLETVGLFVLGRRMGCLDKEMPPDCVKLVDHTQRFFDVTNKMFFGIPLHRIWRNKNWKTLVGSLDIILSYARKLVEEKIDQIGRQSAEQGEGAHAELGEDFLTYMIHSGKMDVQEIAANAIDLLLAGIDTTSLTMCGCLYALGTNPEVQEKLREEVQRVVGEEAMVTPQHIQDMHYLRDTIKESMRLYPIVANNSRILKEDVVLSGYHIPAGVSIVMSTYVGGHLPEFFPNPEAFQPERWSRDNVELPSAFSSLPFGFGRRMCVGRRVAELEMHILLAQMVRNFRIEYREKDPMEFEFKLLFRPTRQMNLALVDI